MAEYFGDASLANQVSTVEGRLLEVSATQTLETKAPVSTAGAAQMFEVTLPLPPSVNKLFKNVRRGRAKTREYIDWCGEAKRNIDQAQIAPVSGPYTLTIRVPSDMRGDVSNRIKAVEDLLVKLKLTPDDKHNADVRALRCPEQPAGTCAVIVSSTALIGVVGGPKLSPVVPLQEGAEATKV